MTNNEKDLSDSIVSQSREIKFRLIDTTNNKVCGYERIENGQRKNRGINESKDSYGHGVYYYGEYIRQQYTLLKDKNGVEIYEGDIVCFDEYQKNCLVTYEKARYVLKRLDKDKPAHIPEYTELSYREFEVRVVGNIYENQDLLSG